MRPWARSAWPDFSPQEIRPKPSPSVTSVSSREPAHTAERARDLLLPVGSVTLRFADNHVRLLDVLRRNPYTSSAEIGFGARPPSSVFSRSVQSRALPEIASAPLTLVL